MSQAWDVAVDGGAYGGPVEIYGLQLYSIGAGACELVCRVTRRRLFRATPGQQQNSYPFFFFSPLHCPHGFEVIELSTGANMLIYFTTFPTT